MSTAVTRPVARRDLLRHFSYIADFNPKAAERFMEAAGSAINLLAEMPTLGSLLELQDEGLEDIRYWSIRKFEKYVIIYRPIENGIEVLRVFQGGQDIDAILKASLE
jgi:toxin ParE1/3/4